MGRPGLKVVAAGADNAHGVIVWVNLFLGHLVRQTFPAIPLLYVELRGSAIFEACSLVREGLFDARFDERVHDGVAGLVGVDAVGAEVFGQAILGVLHRGVEVDVDVVLLGGVALDPGIEGVDLRRGLHAALPPVVDGGEDGAEDDADVVGGGEVGHGGEVVLNLVEGFGAGVAGDVVGSGEDDDGFGLKVDDVLAEAEEHLRGGLAADAAVDVGLAGKVLVEVPALGDGVAHEDDALFTGRGRAEFGVGIAEVGEPGEVTEHEGVVLTPVGVVGVAGRRKLLRRCDFGLAAWLLRAAELGGEQRWSEDERGGEERAQGGRFHAREPPVHIKKIDSPTWRVRVATAAGTTANRTD